MEKLDTKKNLCPECCYCFPECPATENDIIFGDGIVNDNICYCEKMIPKLENINIKKLEIVS